ncbi:ligand-binding sensor domain-containing diguanylate cyclase [Idiomarina seosinensis]|uniref:diguanylate cyclase n=1 Tax=Idiomarina seosinensis TaxID=281739 RepID=A0A432ZIB2_9GAMM|nr:ligand-binding sensor domain-containing diguanylate cyclase [Idiomarina seosinensis]RUO77726.1 hypothetical protein CWI81_04410 [Idiomarina seosinensis]
MPALKRHYFALLFIVATATPFSSHSLSLPEVQQGESLEHFIRETWTTRRGLPHNSVNAIVQDQSGYLWLGTWQGPTRFNGRDFTIYDDLRVTGLPDIGIFTLDINPCNGSLYVAGARGGISRYDEGQWLELKAAPPFVNQVNVDQQCNLWVASSEQGLLFYENDQRTAEFTIDNGLPSNAVYQSLIDDDGNLWAATNLGLAVKAANNTQFELIDSIPPKLIRELHRAPDGRIMVGTQEGVYRQSKGFNFDRYLPDFTASISSLHHSPAGDLWIGTYRQGVWRFRDGNMESLDVDSGLPNNHVLDITHDHEGSVWVSTHGGLVQFRDALFTSYTTAHGLSGNYVRAIFEWQGGVYIGTSNGITRIDKNGSHPVAVGTELENQSVLSFAEHNGQLVIGTYTGGAFVWDGEQIVKHYNQANGLPDNEVRKIASNNDDGLFLGGPAGISHVTADTLGLITTKHGLHNNYTTALAFDSSGTLWSGSVSGVAKIDIQHTDNGFQYQAEAVDLSQLNDAQLAFQIEEQSGYLWLATDRGLIAHKQGTDDWRIFNRDTGLPFDNFMSVAFDGKANLWIGSNRGALFIPHDAFTKTLKDPSVPLEYQRYTEVDGMSNSQINSGGPSLFQSSAGRVWFATANGASVVDPHNMSRLAETAPPAVIAQVSADGQVLSYGEQLPADIQRITFDYAGLGYLMSDHIRYQVRLLGFDEGWVNKESVTTAEYTSLPANDYLFQVRASYPGGSWSEPATFAFTRLEHFWQRPTTWVLSAFLLALITFIIVRTRIRFLNRSRHQLELMVKEKTTELEAIARQDPLTGLGNRRAFDEYLQHEIKRSQRNHHTLSLAILDIDFFKQVNDRFLHTVGDQVLVELAQLLRRVLREVDYAARWGGEEFAILMPDTGLEDAVEAADRIRRAVEQHDFSKLLDDCQLTVSIGVASNQHYAEHSSLLVAADQALYQAKANGRNRTEYK